MGLRAASANVQRSRKAGEVNPRRPGNDGEDAVLDGRQGFVADEAQPRAVLCEHAGPDQHLGMVSNGVDVGGEPSRQVFVP